MRRFISAGVVALLCAGLLCSCTLIARAPDWVGRQLADSNSEADREMQLIMNDVRHRDPDALKALFSKTARAKASDLSSGLKNFLAFFPSGFKNLGEPDGGPGETDETDFGKRTVELFGNYKVSANGKLYELFFADFPINQALDPNNVGLYALGVAPYNAKPGTNPTAASNAFSAWQGQFEIVDHKATGTPSVYIYEPQR